MKFEYLSFEGSNKTKKFGIGYGEMEIIKYAYDNSQYFKYNDFFWKITGRIKIENINKILAKSKKNSMVFLNYYKWFDTRFYKMPVQIYKDYFKDIDIAKIVKKDDRQNLEMIYYNVYKDNNLDIHYSNTNFSNYPIFFGISGSRGVNYIMKKQKVFINNLLCKLNLFNNQIIQYLYLRVFSRK